MNVGKNKILSLHLRSRSLKTTNVVQDALRLGGVTICHRLLAGNGCERPRTGQNGLQGRMIATIYHHHISCKASTAEHSQRTLYEYVPKKISQSTVHAFYFISNNTCVSFHSGYSIFITFTATSHYGVFTNAVREIEHRIPI